MGEKRIIEHEASDEIFNDDWLLKDSALNGTKKVQPSVIKEYMNQGMATSQDLADEATARQNMDNQLASGISKQMSNLADFYDTTKSYVVGDVCVLPNGELKRCIAPTSGEFDITKWESVTIDELFDDLNFSAEAISYDNTSSGLEADDVQDAIDEVVADVDAVETALETKAEVDGFYDELYAGNLLSDNTETDNAPYLYRQSPSGKSYVDLSVVGGTVVWNQLVQNGDFATTTRWDYTSGTFSVANNIGTFTAQSQGQQVTQVIPYILNHKYLGIMQIKTTTATESIWLRFYGQNKVHTTATTNWQTVATIVNSIVDSSNSFGVRDDRTSSWDAIQIKNANLFDLTQMLGSTIADYIYSLEQATAGSGIAWLKANGFLTKNYYPYDSGSLQSVKTSGRKIVGVNVWDEEWEVGNINDGSGEDLPQDNVIRSKGYISVMSGENYYIKCPTTGISRLFLYAEDKSFITYVPIDNITDNIYTIPNNCAFIRFRTLAAYGTTYNNDISINYPSTDTEYHAYEEHTYPLSPIDLRGIPKLDSNNNLYYDGDIYESDGSVKRRYGVVDLGSLSWTALDNNRYKATVSDLKIATIRTLPMLCSKYITNIGGGAYDDKTIYNGSSEATIIIVDSTITSTSQITGDLIYPLATPTTETADAYENPQLVGSTEEFIDTRDVPIPAGGERKYHTDLKAKLEELAKIPDVPSTNGTYTLKATRSASGVTFAWVSD